LFLILFSANRGRAREGEKLFLFLELLIETHREKEMLKVLFMVFLQLPRGMKSPYFSAGIKIQYPFYFGRNRGREAREKENFCSLFL
jgi:hypothetical protein